MLTTDKHMQVVDRTQ